MKCEDRTVLGQTTQLTHKRSYWWLPSQYLIGKITSEVKFAERKSALLQKNNVWKKKKILPFVQSYSNPAVASPKEQLYEQTTSNPAFTERNIQKPNAYLLACSAGVFFERAICLRKRHVETSQREEHLP